MNDTANHSFETNTENSTNQDVDLMQYIEYRTALMIWNVWPPCLLVLGGFGNIATIFVMRRMRGRNSSQHVILISLAVADFSLLYFGVFRHWLYLMTQVDVRSLHSVVCKIHVWFVYSLGTLSAWLLTCVTVQRTLAVTWPHKMRVMCTVRRTWTVVAVLVVTAFSLHSHLVVGMDLSTDDWCSVVSASYEDFFARIFTWLDMCVSSLFPSICLLGCDIILSLTLFRATSSSSKIIVHNAANTATIQCNNTRRKTASQTTLMILALSCTFLLLTFPVCVYFIWYNKVWASVMTTPEGVARAALIHAVTAQLWYTNSAINFLLYCFTGTKFRREFLGWFPCVTLDHTAATGGGDTTATALSDISKHYDSTTLSDRRQTQLTRDG